MFSMANKYIVAIVITVIAGVVVIVSVRPGASDPYRDQQLLSEFKRHCRVVEQGLFQDDLLGIRFRFNPDALVCDYRPPVQQMGLREIYVWRRDAFRSSRMLGFGEGVMAKITINPVPGIPAGTTVEVATEMVAGKPTAVRTVRPASCNSEGCPTARVVELIHRGNTVILEEFASDANLFRSFELLSPDE
jgi:hypothetical protein